MDWKMNDQEQEAIIQGVSSIITTSTDSSRRVFNHFREDEEFRSRVAAFISRCGIDTCYCLTGGNYCDQCFTDGIIAHDLISNNQLYLKNLIIFLLRTNKMLNKKIMRFAQENIQHILKNKPRIEICNRINSEEWGTIIKTTEGIFLNEKGQFSSLLEHFRNSGWVCNYMVRLIMRWGMSTSPCLTLGHHQHTCFLGPVLSRIILGPDPIRRDELLLVLFHLNVVFRKRVAEFMIRRGTDNCYCWNNGHGCTYSFVRLGALS